MSVGLPKYFKTLVHSLGLVFAFVIGAIYLGLNPNRIQADGISYLDLADAYLRFDLPAMANSSWSPLYPMILAGFKLIVPIQPENEFLLVQIVNTLMFFCTALFFHGLYAQIASNISSIFVYMTGYLVGYCVFLYCSLGLIGSLGVTPDMLLLGIVILICITYLRWIDDQRISLSIFLGILCGLAFLTKAVFFFISIIFLGMLIFITRRKKKTSWRLAFIPAAVFLIVVAPWVTFLSVQKGRPTFSDIGWINYCLDLGTCTNPVDSYYVSDPTINEVSFYSTRYAEATFPPWFDLSESREGTKLHLSLAKQFEKTLSNFVYAKEIVIQFYSVPFLILIAWFGVKNKNQLRDVLRSTWLFWFVAFVGLAAYSLTHFEERYLSPLIMLVFIPIILAYVRCPFDSRQKVVGLLLSTCALFLLFPCVYPLKGAQKMRFESSQTALGARNARESGLERGSKIVMIGDGHSLFWAKLAGVKIVGTFKSAGEYRALSQDRRDELLCILKQRNITAIVTAPATDQDLVDGWKEIVPNTSYALLTNCAQFGSANSDNSLVKFDGNDFVSF